MHVASDCLATLEYRLTWRSRDAEHEERFLARKVNFWRDVFPPRMAEALQGLDQGRSVTLEYAPGEALPRRDPSLVHRLSPADFRHLAVSGRSIAPRPGRWYPRGLFNGLPGVFISDMRPALLRSLDDSALVADLNHPLADTPFTLTATVLNVARKDCETGGRLSHWLDELCCYGPGMQEQRVAGRFPLSVDEDASAYARPDEADDALFHAEPRLVGHVDAQASQHLKDMARPLLQPGARVLDLMASYETHAPRDMDLEVAGLGLNTAEMEANPALNSHVVHDLNQAPVLPFGDRAFDAVVCDLSVEYLLRPVQVLKEAARVLRPGGMIRIAFSNRWFPAKVTALWPDLHEFERQGLVLDWLRAADGFTGCSTQSVRNWWRPEDDPHIRQTWISDPVYAVTARRES